MSRVITLIPGDGTGPELTEAARRVIEATGADITWEVRHAGVDVMEKAVHRYPTMCLNPSAGTKWL